jgi:hypothetical protein
VYVATCTEEDVKRSEGLLPVEVALRLVVACHERIPGVAAHDGAAELLGPLPHHLLVLAAVLALGARVGPVVVVVLLRRPRRHRVARQPGGARAAHEHVDARRRRGHLAVGLVLLRPLHRPVGQLLGVLERPLEVARADVRVLHGEVLRRCGLQQLARRGHRAERARHDEHPHHQEEEPARP